MTDPDIRPVPPGNPAEQHLRETVARHLAERAVVVLPEPDPDTIEALRKGEPLP